MCILSSASPVKVKGTNIFVSKLEDGRQLTIYQNSLDIKAPTTMILPYPNKNNQLVELIDLTLAITNINTWNRINLAFPNEPGTYKVGQFG